MEDEEYTEYVGMLRKWRFSPTGTTIFQTGTEAWSKFETRFQELRAKAYPDQLVKASKEVGW